jgi:hypothetical protein
LHEVQEGRNLFELLERERAAEPARLHHRLLLHDLGRRLQMYDFGFSFGFGFGFGG